VTVTEAASDEPFFELLEEGAIDLAFVYLPACEGPFDVSELIRAPWALAVRADSELGRRGTPPAASELTRLPLIGPKVARVSESVEVRLAAEAGTPRVALRTDVAETALALVSAGLGAAIVLRLAVDEHHPSITLLDLGELLPPLGIGVAWHRSRRLSGPVAAFRDAVRDVCDRDAPRRRRAFEIV
jgi:DNA-binding transcriptional LysR family regulator